VPTGPSVKAGWREGRALGSEEGTVIARDSAQCTV